MYTKLAVKRTLLKSSTQAEALSDPTKLTKLHCSDGLLHAFTLQDHIYYCLIALAFPE